VGKIEPKYQWGEGKRYQVVSMKEIGSMKHSGNAAARRGVLRLFALFLLITLVITGAGQAVPAQAAPSTQGVAKFNHASCMFALPMGWTEGVEVDCGYLTVPEQYENPDGPTIQLAVAILHSMDPNKLPDPLVMLQGGPGGSTIDTYTQILPTQKRIPGNRDVVLFDQRGTLYSKPALTCPEFMDLTIQTLNEDLSSEESNRLSLEALQKCHSRLVQEGANLSAYDSVENAADVESLRQALGYEKINLYGVSYGTLLALHVMREHPQGLRSVIIDSVVPTQTNFVLGAPKSENRSFEALFDACKSNADCNANYPNLRDVFYKLADDLNAKPAKLKLTDMDTGTTYDAIADGDTLISTVFQMMYNTDLIPLLPRVIYDARAGNWGFIERILSVVVFDRTMSYGMYYSVLCAEDADFKASDYDLSGLPKQLVEMEKDSAQYILDACKIWKVDELGAAADAPVTSDIPTLVLSGAFDPITPPDYAKQAAEGLSKSFFFLFPAGGHGEVGSTACADNILLAFLDNPNQAPDASCIAKGDGPKFSTPSTLVKLPVLIKLLNLQDGTGIQLGIYLVGLIFLLSALAVYPLVWLVRLLRGKPKPPVYPLPQAGNDPMVFPTTQQPLAEHPAPRPLLYRLAPWVSTAAALLLLIFTGILIAVAFNLALKNDVSILLGLPGSTRPLFILPVLALLAVLAMLGGAFGAWARRAGSVWGRIYLTLLSFSALGCIAILGVWGMLTALFV
jgi:pimeloyl-ACP methyl ester carboxylesterase